MMKSKMLTGLALAVLSAMGILEAAEKPNII